MTDNNDLKRKINKAYKSATPNVLDAVLRDCENAKGRIIMITENKKTGIAKKALAIAAALVLIIGGALGVTTYTSNNLVASIVSLDVNPSVEIKVNKQERVIEVIPLNDEGKVVVGDMDFKGSDIDVAVNALIGSMLREGYLNDLANSILVSVDGDDNARNTELQARIADKISSLLNTGDFSGSVLSQTVNHDAELDTLAKQYGITAGKAQLIREIISTNTHLTFEELSKLSINELNLLNNGNTLEKVTSIGTASDKKYVGAEAAKAAALSHAGVAEADIREYECELDYEKGVMAYEIEFDVGGYDYDYEINATDCTVIKSNKKHDDDCRFEDCDHPSHAAVTIPVQDNYQGEDAGNYDSQPTSAVSREQAIEIALAHAGVAEGDAYELECERDIERGVTVYEVDFESGSYDYDYEINADTGEVLKHSKKFDDDNIWDGIENALTGNNGAPAGSDEFITAEQAIAAALEHAKIDKSEARGLECEFDRADDAFEKDKYDVEFSSGKYDYDYEIDAVTGKVIKSEKERDD